MKRPILFDATRLLSRTEREAPTGVDRVCLAYAEWLLALPEVRVQAVRSRRGELIAVNEKWFRQTIKDLRGRWTGGSADGLPCREEVELVAALESGGQGKRVVRTAAPVPAAASPKRKLKIWHQLLSSAQIGVRRPRQIYINVGHTGLDDDSILGQLARDGVDCVIFLHDLIPITHPEYCRPGDSDRHRGRVVTSLRHASRIIVNSAYTAEELTAFAVRESLPTPPIHVAYLGLEPIFFRPLEPISGRPYFVHVGTIEARKNLAFLLTIWRRLEERMGAETPQLVLIGRHGWENENVLDHLERSPCLQRLVHHVADLPDTSLARLMSGARAVLAPSSVEGFDLPAVEACALRVPLFASDIPAHRELIPEARLIDPLDGLSWLTAIETATHHRPDPTACAASTWGDHFKRVAEAISLADRAAPHLVLAR